MPMSAALAVMLALGQPGTSPPEAPLDWKSLEAPRLTNHVQLTTPEQFVRAGEAYFSPDGEWVIFQAIARPDPGQEPDPFYAMYVAQLRKKDGKITGMRPPVRVSTPDSANTCGWFHPDQKAFPGKIIFGSTIGRPKDDQKAGFQVGSRKYVWMFPQEMEIVTRTVSSMAGVLSPAGHVRRPDGTWEKIVRDWITAPDLKTPSVLFSRPNYDAEGSLDPTGRFLLYAHVEDEMQMGRPDANLYIYDTKTNTQRAIITAPGYDGGPFYSPDARSICYRSDRKGNDLLQLFVARLSHTRDEDGVEIPSGVSAEFQITDNEHVNWCPFWHPSGEFLVYATSEIGHQNYEVFAVKVDQARLDTAAATGPGPHVIPDLPRTRLTQASGADVLPVFSPDGKHMMWTSQRGPALEGEARPSSQLWIAEWSGSPFQGSPK